MSTILLQFWPVFIAEGVALKKQEELASHKLDGLGCLNCWEKRRSSFFSILPSDQFFSIAVWKITLSHESVFIVKERQGWEGCEKNLRKRRVWSGSLRLQASWWRYLHIIRKICKNLHHRIIFSEVLLATDLRQNSLINWRRPWNICC